MGKLAIGVGKNEYVSKVFSIVIITLFLLVILSTYSFGAHRYYYQNIGSFLGSSCWPMDINNNGQIVGYSAASQYTYHAFLWENGNMQDLGTLGGTESEAFAINDIGQVVGHARIASSYWHAFLWDGSMHNLSPPDAIGSSANGINDNGEIVGEISYSETPAHAVLWKDGNIQDLGTLGGTISFGRDINNQGQVVGDSLLSDNSTSQVSHP